jgi:hypothetical protein
MGNFNEDNYPYCTCDEPDIDGDNETGYFCTICTKEIEQPDPPDYEPDYDEED